MSRYFARPRAVAWIEDEYYAPEPGRVCEPSVPEHVATDTGLLDRHGNAIMRSPNPVGFGKDLEW